MADDAERHNTDAGRNHLVVRGRLSIVEHMLGLLCDKAGLSIDLEAIPYPDLSNDDFPDITQEEADMLLRAGRAIAYRRMLRATGVDTPES